MIELSPSLSLSLIAGKFGDQEKAARAGQKGMLEGLVEMQILSVNQERGDAQVSFLSSEEWLDCRLKSGLISLSVTIPQNDLKKEIEFKLSEQRASSK